MSRDPRRRPTSPRRYNDSVYQFGGNSHHDNPRRDFSFRALAYPAPSFPSTGTRNDRNGRRDRGPRRGGYGRGGFRKPGASERAILHSRRSPTPEQLAGMNTGDSRFRILEDLPSQSDGEQSIEEDSSPHVAATKDIPASQVVEDDASEEEDHPRAKRAKRVGVESDTGDGDSKPKWSNPDPYTALPPPGQSQAPKTDVLKLIRNAKLQQESTGSQTAGVDEFISLNFGDDEVDDPTSEESDHDARTLHHGNDSSFSHNADREFVIRGTARNAVDVDHRESQPRRGDRWQPAEDVNWVRRNEVPYNTYRRSRSRSPPRREYGHTRYSISPEGYNRRPSRYSPPRDRVSYHHPQSATFDRYSNTREEDGMRRGTDYPSRRDPRLPPLPPAHLDVWPPPPPPPHYLDSWPPPPPPPADAYVPPSTFGRPAQHLERDRPGANVADGDAGSNKRKRQGVEKESLAIDAAPSWLPRADGDPTPWMVYCSHQDRQTWLHDEIESFYLYVSPREPDRQMRTDLIRRVTEAITAELGRVTVEPFGSSATSLYLPTGDVDLVVLSPNYLRKRYPQIPVHRAALNRFVKNVVRGKSLAITAQVIPSAKVPLIKFTDMKTGLPVDISFENDSGLAAIDTLNGWLNSYPALGKLVHPIKQFLKMRARNEVNTGGLGGFSTICLVVFRLHVLAEQKGAGWAMQNLDLALIDIFEYYGDKFDLEVNGLNMQTMNVIPKSSFNGYRASKPGRLLVVDPNDRANDISGGTSKIKDIFMLFSIAGATLRKELEVTYNTRSAETSRRSMLKSVLGADYSTFDHQRRRLEDLYAKEYRPSSSTNVVDLTASDGEYVPSDEVCITDVRSIGGPVSNGSNSAHPNQHTNSGISSSFQNSNVQHASLSSIPSKQAPKTNKVPKASKPPKGPKNTKQQQPKKQQQPPRTSDRLKSLRSGGVQQLNITPVNAPTAPKRKASDQEPPSSFQPAKKVKQVVPMVADGNIQNAQRPQNVQKEEKKKDKKKRKEKEKEKGGKSGLNNTASTTMGSGSKPVKQTKSPDDGHADQQRARSFRERFPGVQCPEKLSKQHFKDMVNKQRKAMQNGGKKTLLS